jgi:hypothetical protein
MFAIAESLSPNMDLDEVQAKLFAMADQIKTLPIEHPKRQLLAAIRLRSRCISHPFYQRKEQQGGLKCWINIHSSSPLDA